jgi:hypothetical protein
MWDPVARGSDCHREGRCPAPTAVADLLDVATPRPRSFRGRSATLPPSSRRRDPAPASPSGPQREQACTGAHCRPRPRRTEPSQLGMTGAQRAVPRWSWQGSGAYRNRLDLSTNAAFGPCFRSIKISMTRSDQHVRAAQNGDDLVPIDLVDAELKDTALHVNGCLGQRPPSAA